MKYRLAIFDSDGTLADTLPWMRGIFNDLAEQHGFRRVEPHQYERFRNLHGRALLRELGLPIWKLPRVMTSMRKRMAEHSGKLSVFPDVDTVLRRLASSGIRLGVVSSNSQPNVERILGLDNTRLIAHFACGASMFGKAAKLRQVLRMSAIPASEAIYIGDEIRDAEAARKTGMAFGAASWGQHDEQTLRDQNPAEFFHTVSDIADRLCS